MTITKFGSVTLHPGYAIITDDNSSFVRVAQPPSQGEMNTSTYSILKNKELPVTDTVRVFSLMESPGIQRERLLKDRRCAEQTKLVTLIERIKQYVSDTLQNDYQIKMLTELKILLRRGIQLFKLPSDRRQPDQFLIIPSDRSYPVNNHQTADPSGEDL